MQNPLVMLIIEKRHINDSSKSIVCNYYWIGSCAVHPGKTQRLETVGAGRHHYCYVSSPKPCKTICWYSNECKSLIQKSDGLLVPLWRLLFSNFKLHFEHYPFEIDQTFIRKKNSISWDLSIPHISGKKYSFCKRLPGSLLSTRLTNFILDHFGAISCVC